MLALIIYLCINGISGYNNGVGRLPYMGWNTWCTDATCMIHGVLYHYHILSIFMCIILNRWI